MISRVVVFSGDQLHGYQSNAALLLQVLNSTGVLHFTSVVRNQLAPVDIPDRTFLPARSYGTFDLEREFERLSHALDVHQRVAMVGLADPLDYLAGILDRFPEPTRRDQSFAIGMKIAEHRTFTMQFFHETDPQLDRELASHQLRTISFVPRYAKT